MPRRFKTQGIKFNRAYSVDELADVACVSVPTVRNWLKAGMERLDHNRPTMIMGFHALAFLKERKKSRKQPLALGEVYCFGCKAPREPLGAMADYLPTSATSGRLKALCSECERSCNRNIRASDLPEICKVLDVVNKGNW